MEWDNGIPPHQCIGVVVYYKGTLCFLCVSNETGKFKDKKRMMFTVPQFIDVEDKIAGPLTWRQLLWMLGMGGVLLVIFSMFGQIAFFVAAVPVILLFCALAFYRPHGQPLVSLLYHSVVYFFRPKLAVWERPVARRVVKPVATVAPIEPPKAKRISPDELRRLARLMDEHR